MTERAEVARDGQDGMNMVGLTALRSKEQADEATKKTMVAQDSGPPVLKGVSTRGLTARDSVGSVLRDLVRSGQVNLCLSEGDLEAALPFLEQCKEWVRGGALLLYGPAIHGRLREVLCVKRVSKGQYRTFPLVLNTPLTPRHFVVSGLWDYGS